MQPPRTLGWRRGALQQLLKAYRFGNPIGRLEGKLKPWRWTKF